LYEADTEPLTESDISGGSLYLLKLLKKPLKKVLKKPLKKVLKKPSKNYRK
jgi:hypothetical protein